jgi:hypothetical protein
MVCAKNVHGRVERHVIWLRVFLTSHLVARMRVPVEIYDAIILQTK